MMEIAESHGVRIHAHQKGFFSISNSPYHAHKRGSAIDVYPPRGSREAISPVEGKVLLTRPIFSGLDSVTLIEPEGQREVCLKILHVRPALNVGEKIGVGDYLGEIVWSPFYSFWTDYHMHLEIRPITDPLRARRSHEINLTGILEKMHFSSRQRSEQQELTFSVEIVRNRYVLLKNPNRGSPLSSPFIARVGDFKGYLEGGIPHYGHGALVGAGKLQDGQELTVMGIKMHLDHQRQGYFHFCHEKKDVLVNNEIYRGMSINFNDEYLKLIPVEPGKTSLEEGEEVIIELF